MKKLFEGLEIRGHEINNRICVPPMVCFGWSDVTGKVVERNIAHYEAMAKGGYGLIIVEANCVNSEAARLDTNQLGLWEDGQIAGHKELVQAVHKHNTTVCVQIHHAGVVGTFEQLVCPSAYRYTDKQGREHDGKELTVEQIKTIQSEFVAAAIRAYQAGYDGVELHGCHNYLICQFMNKWVNRRTDVYGTNPEVFVQEIYKEIRKNTDEKFIIGIRLGVFEPTLEDGIANAVKMEKIGMDFLNMSYGFAAESQPECVEGFPYKDVVWAAGQVKKAVKIPVFAVNSLQNGEQAQGALDCTDVDMICIGRGVLVNYNWANDVKEGKDPGKCLSCPTCIWRGNSNKCPGKLLYQKAQ